MARIACTSLSSRRLSTGRTCRQPTEACAYQVPRVPCLSKHIREPRGVFREMLQRHRAILDEGDRFPLVLHRHHDVEAGGAHIGDRGLQGRIEHIDHAAPFGAGLVPAETEIAHQFVQLFQAAQIFVVIVLAELDQQHRVRRAAHELLERRPEHRDLARQLDHGAVDQLHRDRRKLHEMLRGIHRLIEAAEMAGADRAAAEQRRQLQFDLGREAERAFRADQNMREIERHCGRGRKRIEIVAADPALHFREARFDFADLARADVRADRARCRAAATPPEDRTDPAAPGRNARAIRPPESRRPTAHSRAYCRSAASAPPQELLPVMPPMVAREAVEISTGNHRPCGFSARLRSSSTMPGSTTQRRPSTSSSRMRLRYFEQSRTSD